MRRNQITSILMALVLVLSVAAGAGAMSVAADENTTSGDDGLEETDTSDNETENDDETDLNESEDNETELNETVDNETLNETGNESGFGQLVSAFVADLQANGTNGTFGHAVATFVLANNPAADKIPDHAGPPTNTTQGPPDNETQGPPEHAGGNDGGGGGPPDHAGGPN